jgi:phosphoribosylformylglycinamidine (FGAM) synthase-like enzyme
MVEKLIHEKLINSAHDISEGGLFVTLCESGFNNELGFSVITNSIVRKDAFLFGEGQSRVVVSVAMDKAQQVESLLSNFPYEKIGVVSSGELVIDGDFWGTIDWWKEKYDTAIENYLTKEEAGSALSSI